MPNNRLRRSLELPLSCLPLGTTAVQGYPVRGYASGRRPTRRKRFRRVSRDDSCFLRCKYRVKPSDLGAEPALVSGGLGAGLPLVITTGTTLVAGPRYLSAPEQDLEVRQSNTYYYFMFVHVWFVYVPLRRLPPVGPPWHLQKLPARAWIISEAAAAEIFSTVNPIWQGPFLKLAATLPSPIFGLPHPQLPRIQRSDNLGPSHLGFRQHPTARRLRRRHRATSNRPHG